MERRPTRRPRPEHEDFARLLRETVLELLEERLPTMATVTGQQGGRVTVHLDGEEEPRDEGLPRKLGQRFEEGDRVLVVFSRSGEPMVVGTISTSTGFNAQGVSADELYDGAVDSTKIKSRGISRDNLADEAVDGAKLKKVGSGGKNGAVTGDVIDSGAIESRHIKTNAVGTDQLAAGAVGNAQISDVAASKLSGTVDDKNLPSYVKPGDVYTKRDIDQKGFLTSKDLGGYAKTSDLSKFLSSDTKTSYQQKTLTAALRDIDQRLKQLEAKVGKASGGAKNKE